MGGGGMLSQIQQMQAQMMQAQEGLADETVEVSVGGGVVSVVANGQQAIQAITIAPEAVDPDDVEMLQDLILAAVNQALEKSRDLASERMGDLTAGLNLPPGLL
ncbi:MAG: YbaB/EbfC family nucleoid-associated protein [Caldilineales bacterium]|nr:YbaB/EbfC family nucleoid-associated protein [Caldilineales bacterium]